MPTNTTTPCIVDAQIHLWTAESVTDHRRAHRPDGFLAEEALREMDAAGVEVALATPAVWAGAVNDYCLEAANRYPDRFRVVARLPFDESSGVGELERLADSPAVVAIRVSATRNAAAVLDDPSTEWMWEAVERVGLPVTIFAPGALDTVRGLVERRPGMRVIVDHVGVPSHTTPESTAAAIAGAVGLADLSNVAVKVSALPCASTGSFPFGDLDHHVAAVRRAFGTGRMMWGSDLTRLPCSYGEAVRHFDRAGWLFAARERASIMGGTAKEWLRWV